MSDIFTGKVSECSTTQFGGEGFKKVSSILVSHPSLKDCNFNKGDKVIIVVTDDNIYIEKDEN